MAKLNGYGTRKAYAKFLATAHQQPQEVYLVKVSASLGGDKLAFGVGGARTVSKVLISPSPFVEDLSMVRAERLGSTYVQGDTQVNFVPPLKVDGADYTEGELKTYTEIWFAPILNEGTDKEAPTSRLYVRRTPNLMIGGVIAVCNWICNPVPPKV